MHVNVENRIPEHLVHALLGPAAEGRSVSMLVHGSACMETRA